MYTLSVNNIEISSVVYIYETCASLGDKQACVLLLYIVFIIRH